MHRKKRGFGRLKLIAFFIFIAILMPKFLRARSTDELGAFSADETGIKLCARINNGNEDALRFFVSSDQGFASDVIVAKDSCKTIETSAATFTIREYVPQEYVLDSVTGGTVSADATSFVATSAGQYTVIYENSYSSKPYLHSFGYTNSNAAATAVSINFDANGGTGAIAQQSFGLNAQQNLTANSFTRNKYIFAGWNTKADGTGDNYSDGQAVTFATGGELTLYAQWEYHSLEAADIVANQASDLGDYTIDFRRKAIVSNDIEEANGNGVNAYTEDGQTVYYYRGDVAGNNVIWANMCWKIVRTTATGGTKLIYNGEVDTENVGGNLVSANTCTATGADTQIDFAGANSSKTIPYNDTNKSPADAGYMYGTRIATKELTADPSTSYVFANDVSYANGVYTLSSDAISGTWLAKRAEAATRYHYFCTDGSASCDGTKIGYITYFVDSFGQSDVIYYLNINGYNDIEEAKAAMNVNSVDSEAKTTIDTWFENENLDGHISGTRNYENDLEDAIFCNDRSVNSGSLKSKDSDATDGSSLFSAYYRNAVDVDNNYHPSLDCGSQDDSFTKEDTTNGNGKLNHKVGLITADELTMAGSGMTGYDESAYLRSTNKIWTMSPSSYGIGYVGVFCWNLDQCHQAPTMNAGLRPVVSLKSGIEFAEGGAGTSTNPYIVVEE